jgi:hypothetical protein
MNDIELLKLALEDLENLVNLAEFAMKSHPYGEWDVKAELESPRRVISLLHSRISATNEKNKDIVQTVDAHCDKHTALRPVAKVAVQIRGGNPGIAWHAVPLESYESLPLMPDGAILYAE